MFVALGMSVKRFEYFIVACIIFCIWAVLYVNLDWRFREDGIVLSNFSYCFISMFVEVIVHLMYSICRSKFTGCITSLNIAWFGISVSFGVGVYIIVGLIFWLQDMYDGWTGSGR